MNILRIIAGLALLLTLGAAETPVESWTKLRAQAEKQGGHVADADLKQLLDGIDLTYITPPKPNDKATAEEKAYAARIARMNELLERAKARLEGKPIYEAGIMRMVVDDDMIAPLFPMLDEIAEARKAEKAKR